LGGQPQIVTFALDWLLARGEQIREVFVVHLSTADDRLSRSLGLLRAEFAGDVYRGRPCRFRATPLRQGATILPAIRTEAEAEVVRQTVFSLVTELKQAGRTLHLCVAGGPRMMGLMALSAAQLHCGHQDKIWHIYTEPDFLEQAQDGAILHDDAGGRVRLVQVPVVPWGQYLASFSMGLHTPAETIDAHSARLEREEHRRCRAVWDDLTGREKEVVRAFAAGLNPQEVAEQLVVTVKTVSSHTTSIFAKCRLVWEMPDSFRFNFHFLRDKFRDFTAEV
jgi:CRISPR-associated protein Csx14